MRAPLTGVNKALLFCVRRNGDGRLTPASAEVLTHPAPHSVHAR